MEKYIKLWKVTVMCVTWDKPRTYYFSTKEKAYDYYMRFEYADKPEYAGRYLCDNTPAYDLDYTY